MTGLALVLLLVDVTSSCLRWKFKCHDVKKEEAALVLAARKQEDVLDET